MKCITRNCVYTAENVVAVNSYEGKVLSFLCNSCLLYMSQIIGLTPKYKMAGTKLISFKLLLNQQEGK